MKQHRNKLAIICCVVCFFLLPLPTFALSSGSTAVTTEVPVSQSLEVIPGGHGAVRYLTYVIGNDVRVDVPRLVETRAIVEPDEGWEVDKVLFGPKGGELVELKAVLENEYIVPPISDDANVLIVSYRKAEATPPEAIEESSPPTTGDDINLKGSMILLLGALFALGAISKIRKKNHAE